MSEQLASEESRKKKGRRPGESVEHAEDPSKKWFGLFCICGSKCRSEYSLSVHIRKFSEEGEFKCELCTEQFFVYKILQKHLELEHNMFSRPETEDKAEVRPRRLGCIDCGKSFPSGEFFRKHRELAHPNAVESPPPVTRQAPPSVQEDESNDSIQFIGVFHDKQSETSTKRKNDDGPPQASSSPKRSIPPKILKGSMKPSALVTASEQEASSSSASMATHPIKKKVRLQVPTPAEEGPPPTPPPLPLTDVLENLGVIITTPNPNQQPSTVKTSRPKRSEKMFGCAICNNAFTRVYDLQRHLKNTHRVDTPTTFPIGCPHCLETFRTKGNCIQHYLAFHKPPPPIECKPKLPLASASRDSVAVPIFNLEEEDDEYDGWDENLIESPPLSPQEIIPFITYVPAASLSSPAEDMNSPLDIFVDLHQPDTTKKVKKIFYCTCGKKFRYKKCFEAHIMQETQTTHQWNFQCNCCKKFFPSKPQLKAHTKKVHKMLVVESEDGGGEWALVGCGYCETRFETFDQLLQHQEGEHNVKIARRTKLRKTARSRSRRNGMLNLIKGNSEHYQVVCKDKDKESDEFVYKCACGFKYKYKGSLWKHVKQNLLGQFFQKCLYCPKKFACGSTLKFHTKLVHNVDLLEGDATVCNFLNV